ncbi:hypothetical protein Y1Q_0015144 [Alligator mississippiensis]|uniref:SAP domain-containing protein n=1 Tax=Alligator mississippiensis TaxID=8496 RepID=A0A151P9R1_ALLMI|nr:hypothetical protein Y1Q_0015144 [Alligator mississippiensis]
MAGKYDHMMMANLKELMKERGLPVRKEQKRESLIKILCDNDYATRSPPHVLPEPTGDTEELSSEWDIWKFQLQLEAEEQEHKFKHELELKRMELEAQHQHEELEAQCQHEKEQHEHNTREAQLQSKHELAALRMKPNAETAGTQPTLAAPPRLNTPVFSRYKDGDDPEVFLSNFKNQVCHGSCQRKSS